MSKTITTLRAGTTALMPIYPETFDDVVRLARMAIMAGMLKPLKSGWGDDAQEESPDATQARATMIIMQGMELGVPPMQVVQLFAMINGRITAHSEAVPGILLSKGFKIAKTWSGAEMTDDWTAVCTLTRPTGETFVGKFSVTQAKRARLWSPGEKIKKKGKNGYYEADNDASWHRFPDRMLWARALGFAAKDGAADALKGLMVREEMEDMIRAESARDITPTTKQIAALDIPDIPDEADTDTEARQVPAASAEQHDSEVDEPLADPIGYLDKLAEDIAICNSVEELAEIAESNAHMIARLPPKLRHKASNMLQEAAE